MKKIIVLLIITLFSCQQEESQDLEIKILNKHVVALPNFQDSNFETWEKYDSVWKRYDSL